MLQRAGDPDPHATSRPPVALMARTPDEIFDSPVILHKRPGTRVGWVGSVDHAWRRIAFLGDSEGDLTVALDRGATAEVTVTSVPQSARHPKLRVYYSPGRTDGGSDAVEPLFEGEFEKDGTTLLERLPAGTFTFTVVPDGASRTCGPRVGEVVAQLEPGVTTEVLLDLADERSRQTLADLRIQLSNEAPGRKLSNLTRLALWPAPVQGASPVGVLPLARYLATELRDSQELEVLWEGLVPGVYAVALLPQGAQSEVRLEAGREEKVELMLSTPVEVLVSVLHGRRPELARDAVVRYRPSLARGRASWSEVQGASRADGRHRLGCLPGSVQLAVSYPGHATAMRTIDVPADGPVEVNIQLTPAERWGLELHALQGELKVPLPLSFWERVSVRQVSEGTGRLVGTRFGTRQVGGLSALDAASAEFFVNGAGLYEVLLPSLPGMVTCEEARLELATIEGGTAEASFQVSFE
ncbi:MAG: carboxypeptidase regulatory-like domain-containing protein [Candidatus Eisenbacteria bacterium]|uniref:Carboxypeptidase regulatory-like domain-containing protein n=1 Tax=Eiseniibacteriota bacterium TaxID=2212470 RepID=A0A956RQB4_UNCEI|nr:carboxypeptidase regulatory-like domain-containing protein [Candidatus Eisenbacteria bacterium]